MWVGGLVLECLCMYTHTFVYTHICIHTHLYTHTHTCVYYKHDKPTSTPSSCIHSPCTHSFCIHSFFTHSPYYILTGNLWLLLPEGRVDVGLCVKVPAKGLVVPDFAHPNAENKGWEYSESFVQVLEQYKVCGEVLWVHGWGDCVWWCHGCMDVVGMVMVLTAALFYVDHTHGRVLLLIIMFDLPPTFQHTSTHLLTFPHISTHLNTHLLHTPPPTPHTQQQNQFSWVFAMMEADPEANSYEPKTALPNLSPEAQSSEVQRLRKWLSKLPATRRPLVKTSTILAPEGAIKALQSSMPSAYTRKVAPIELEQVQPAFLMPPVQASGFTTALAGGSFDLGDRIVSVRYVVVGVWMWVWVCGWVSSSACEYVVGDGGGVGWTSYPNRVPCVSLSF